MVDVKTFIERKGMTKADLCRELGIDSKSSLMSSYEKGRSDPSYDKCEKLIRLGITAQELFGEKLGTELLDNSLSVQSASRPEKTPIDYKDPEFQEQVRKAMLEIEERKKKGLL